MSQTIRELYDAWVAADHAWSDAIKATFPKRWPGDVRYMPEGRGAPGSPLRAAYDACSVSANAFRDAGGFDRLFKRGPLYETSDVTSDARKICRAFDAAEEREKTELGV